jgi:LuxR family maltose regulon positive regulatory protein
MADRKSQSAVYLATKLYIPPARPGLVVRPRLLERLDAGLAHKLTLISAPPGFGKTTLLAEWIANRKWQIADSKSQFVIRHSPFAWVSLDEGDNDPIRFWRYVVVALQTVHPVLGQTTLAALESPQPPPLEPLVTALINDVAALPVGAPLAGAHLADAPPGGDREGRPYPGDALAIVLVLDDYHAIEATPVHASLDFLLDHLPSQLHLVITSRAEPPLSLARRRARAELAEIRTADLRFTPAEAAEFLNASMGLGLSPFSNHPGISRPRQPVHRPTRQPPVLVSLPPSVCRVASAAAEPIPPSRPPQWGG